MYLGREIRRPGIAGALGFMKTKDMAKASRAAFDELGATVRSLSSPVGEMSGGQRQAIAIARAVHWAGRLVFLDEPTAALGVRQTKNVLETIRRVRDKGIAVVLISHSMPHVMEVCDRIQVLRLGDARRQHLREGHLHGRTRRAHDRRRHEGRLEMSTTTPPTETVAIGTFEDTKPNVFVGLLKAQAFQILLILIVIVLIFSALAPDSFAQWSNFRLIIQNASILAVLGVGMTYIIITSGIDLSIGSVLVFSGVVSALTMRALGGEGWGVATVGILVSIFSGVCWGLLNGFLIAKAKIPPLIVTLGSLGMALGLAQILTGGVDIRDVPTVLTVSIGYGNVFGSLPIISVIALVVVVIGAVVLHFTKFASTPTPSAPASSPPAASASRSTATSSRSTRCRGRSPDSPASWPSRSSRPRRSPASRRPTSTSSRPW